MCFSLTSRRQDLPLLVLPSHVLVLDNHTSTQYKMLTELNNIHTTYTPLMLRNTCFIFICYSIFVFVFLYIFPFYIFNTRKNPQDIKSWIPNFRGILDFLRSIEFPKWAVEKSGGDEAKGVVGGDGDRIA